MIGNRSLYRKFARLTTALIVLVLLAFPVSTALAAGHSSADSPGAVYTMTNAADGNEVIVFQRGADGAMTPGGSYATGGLGSGAGLGSQSALVLSENHRWLLAVNAGSNQISVFAVQPDGLMLTDVVDSGGLMPISVTVHNHLVYVLNAGGSGNITGYKLSQDGTLHAIADSTRYLSNGGIGASTAPAQISFAPDGKTLVVTEKGTNQILTYRLGPNGFDGPEVHASSGQTPFGFAFSGRSTLIVSEAFGGAAGASAVSSYQVSRDTFHLIDGSAPTFQTAACWIAVTKNGKYAYTTNAGSSSLSGYRVGQDGMLTLLNADGFTASTGPGSSPIDMAFSTNSQFLYVISGRSFTISAFAVQADGALVPLEMENVPVGSVGLAAY